MSNLQTYGYIPKVEEGKMSIYDGHTTTITVSGKAVMEGWYVTKENMWWIPLVKNFSNTLNTSRWRCQNAATYPPGGSTAVNKQRLSAYELKTRPELICYYHAVMGFPMK